MNVRRFLAVGGAGLLLATASACGSDPGDTAGAGTEPTETDATTAGGEWPVTIEHAFGTTEIESPPERVATVNWANHEVPLALGIVPVGMAAANFGDDDGDGLLPWVSERLEELDAEVPVLFDETDGIDFEAVADTEPDVILAAYSGLTEEDYATLSEIAPVVAYPEAAWATPWRDIIELNSAGLGKADEGAALIGDLEEEIEAAVADHPVLQGKTAMFMSHVDPTDLSEVGFYTSHDTRTQFFEDLGMEIAGVVEDASTSSDRFSSSISSEQIQELDEVDIIVTYADDGGELLDELQADPLTSRIPALQRGSVVFFSGSTPLATAANPTPLSLSWVLQDYVAMLAEAAGKVA